MTIDEAIKELTESYNFWMGFACDDVLEEGEHKVNNCEENANHCYQLIQWLEELKLYQQLDLDIPQHFTKEQGNWIKTYCIQKNKEFYKQGIDDFSKKIVSRKEDFEEYYLNDRKSIALANIAIAEANFYLEMAEQLKGGARDEK